MVFFPVHGFHRAGELVILAPQHLGLMPVEPGMARDLRNRGRGWRW
jgi:hypothetical protein